MKSPGINLPPFITLMMLSLVTILLQDCWVQAQGSPTFLRGDSNRDGRIDISDATCTLQYLFLGSCRVNCPEAADANDDGELDISDPVYLLHYLFLGGTMIPEPFPENGPDPTEDALGCAPEHCVNGMLDDGETDVDCGGECPPCPYFSRCLTSADCMSPSFCFLGTCVGSGDGIKDYDETDVDCGGTVAPPCTNGLECISSEDCESGACVTSPCGWSVCVPQHCVNGVLDEGETDVDVGGDCPSLLDCGGG